MFYFNRDRNTPAKGVIAVPSFTVVCVTAFGRCRVRSQASEADAASKFYFGKKMSIISENMDNSATDLPSIAACLTSLTKGSFPHQK